MYRSELKTWWNWGDGQITGWRRKPASPIPQLQICSIAVLWGFWRQWDTAGTEAAIFKVEHLYPRAAKNPAWPYGYHKMMKSRSYPIERGLRFLILHYSVALYCPSCFLNLPITILSPQPTQYPTCQLNPTPIFSVDQFPKNYEV